MSRWFRHYAGMMRDDKLVRAAVQSKQPVERVVWIWGAILESAAEKNDGGRYELDPGEVAYFLRCDEHDVGSILACLENLGRLAEGRIVRWGDRQFDSDTSRERQRKYRERKAKSKIFEEGGDAGSNASDVTVTSSEAEVTPQETETESEKKESADFEQFWKTYPDRDGDDPKKPARLAYARALKRGATVDGLLAAANAYRGKNPTATRFIPRVTTWLNEDRWKADEPKSEVPVAGVIPSTFVLSDDRFFTALSAEVERETGKPAKPYQTQQGYGRWFATERVKVHTAEAAA